MVSNIDRVYATEYSRKKKKKEKFSYRGIDRLSTVFSPISTRVGREISIVSSDKTSACGEAAPDFERYERCNWSTAEARLTIRRDLETASTISLGRRWPPQLPFATLERRANDYVDYITPFLTTTNGNGIESFLSTIRSMKIDYVSKVFVVISFLCIFMIQSKLTRNSNIINKRDYKYYFQKIMFRRYNRARLE